MLSENDPIGTGMTARKEQCKPDYEAMIANLQKKFDKHNHFKEAALKFFEGRRARGKIAELIGELVTECNMLAGNINLLIKQQENDQE